MEIQPLKLHNNVRLNANIRKPLGDSYGKISFEKIDQISFKKKNYNTTSNGNVIQIVSFGKKPDIPVWAVKANLNCSACNATACQLLADSSWYDGMPLEFQVKAGNIIVYKKPFGMLGILPEDMTNKLLPLMNNKHNFKIELASIRGDNTFLNPVKIRVNVKYDSGDNDIKTPLEVSTALKDLLNQKSNKKNIFPYQPVIKPEELLKMLVPEEVVSSIIKEINNADNILLVSHTNPDGDAIGSILGLGAALEATGKKVDCSIDDNLDGHYRHKLPGIDEKLKKPSQLPEDKTYDLAIIMDTPVPQRLGDNNKYIKSAKKIVIIDHHDVIQEKWDKEKHNTGIDIEKIKQQNLFWVRPEMPAVAQMVAALVFKIMPEDKRNQMQIETRQAIAKPLAAGIYSDTFHFKHGAEQKPESVTKFLLDWAESGKKWLCKTINYVLPPLAHKKMVALAMNPVIDDRINYACYVLDYNQLMEIFKTAKKEDPDIIMNDVINQLKFSDAFKRLTINPNNGNEERISALIIQEKDRSEDGEDLITVSFRSPSGTDYAERLAKKLNGGGHPSIAATQIRGISLKDRVYDDARDPANKLSLESKIIQLIEEIRNESPSGILDGLKKAG